MSRKLVRTLKNNQPVLNGPREVYFAEIIEEKLNYKGGPIIKVSWLDDDISESIGEVIQYYFDGRRQPRWMRKKYFINSNEEKFTKWAKGVEDF